MQARFEELVAQIHLKITPRLLISLKVDVPMAIGWLKPVVLLPASMISGLNNAQLEMLILHELAHANDFMPPNSFTGLNTQNTPFEEISSKQASWISTDLNNISPLNSETMLSLAQVMYTGTEATSTEKDLSAREVGDAFEPDGSAFAYAYTSQFEDLAMLFEMSMMRYFYNVDAEIAFTNAANKCEELFIGWGVINRIGENHVNSRAEFISSKILTEINFDTFFENYSTPETTSGGWCIPETSTSSANVKSNTKRIPKLIPKNDYLRPYL